jgi:hypothetical protein
MTHLAVKSFASPYWQAGAVGQRPFTVRFALWSAAEQVLGLNEFFAGMWTFGCTAACNETFG